MCIKCVNQYSNRSLNKPEILVCFIFVEALTATWSSSCWTIDCITTILNHFCKPTNIFLPPQPRFFPSQTAPALLWAFLRPCPLPYPFSSLWIISPPLIPPSPFLLVSLLFLTCRRCFPRRFRHLLSRISLLSFTLLLPSSVFISFSPFLRKTKEKNPTILRRNLIHDRLSFHTASQNTKLVVEAETWNFIQSRNMN